MEEEKSENLLKRLEDGWEGHRKVLKLPKDFEEYVRCDYCNNDFKSSLENNLKKEQVLIYLSRRCKEKLASFGGADWKKVYQLATMYLYSCPECGHKEELFIVPNDPRKIVKI